MFLSNLHTHSYYSDGQSHIEEYILSAIEKGFVSIGFSDHTEIGEKYKQYSPFTQTLSPEDYQKYINEIISLRDKYRKEIEIYIGIEDDYLPYIKKDWLDYSIGAVHFLQSPVDNMWYGIDFSLEIVNKLIEHFGGVENYIAHYYNQFADILKKYKPNIAAHIDLVSKLNKNNILFDENAKWYKDIINCFCEKLAKYNIIVEINTGGIFRGYADTPYPNKNTLKSLNELGVPITISSDCHHVNGLNFQFKEAIEYAKNAGYNKAKILKNYEFIDIKL